MSVDSDTQVTLSFTGNATAHASSDDVSDLTVTFAAGSPSERRVTVPVICPAASKGKLILSPFLFSLLHIHGSTFNFRYHSMNF